MTKKSTEGRKVTVQSTGVLAGMLGKAGAGSIDNTK
jgi:hypothetical protein